MKTRVRLSFIDFMDRLTKKGTFVIVKSCLEEVKKKIINCFLSLIFILQAKWKKYLAAERQIQVSFFQKHTKTYSS